MGHKLQKEEEDRIREAIDKVGPMRSESPESDEKEYYST